MNVKTVGVVGSGQMGAGIAQVSAFFGFQVTLLDIKKEFLDKSLTGISNSLDRLIKKGTITEEQKKSTLVRIKTTTNYSDLSSVDLVVEAATENIELKLQIFKNLDEVTPPH